jgi:hypothetical protein
MKNRSSQISGVESEFLSELDLPAWSVISFEKVEGSGLTYPEALRLQEELESRSVAGLCVVTDEAASRI